MPDGLNITDPGGKRRRGDIRQYVTVTVNDEFVERGAFDSYRTQKTVTKWNSCTSWEEAPDNGIYERTA